MASSSSLRHGANGYPDPNESLQLIEEMESSGQVPSMSLLRQIITQLETSDADFVEEQEMQTLKQKVVTQIRRNRDLEAKIEEADRRIGSLVRNYHLVTSKDSLRLLKLQEEGENRSRGVTDFSSDGRSLLSKYEDLFYLLQTRPSYLSKLLIHESKGRFSVQKTYIYTLFPQLTVRESHLLLNLFMSMMEEETDSLIQNPADVIDSDSISLKLAIDFYIKTSLSSLFSCLKPLITEVIQARHVNLSIDPVSIYKTWIKDMEAESTCSTTKYPYTVTGEEALSYPQVEKILNQAVNHLIRAANRFLETFTREEFIQEIPYGLRFLCHHLSQLMSSKFPGISKSDLLMIVANIIYYRFIGSCISCPEASGLIQLRPGEITHQARSNLGNISKLLSAAASGTTSSLITTSDRDTYKSMALTTFVSSAHETFVQFFRSVLVIPNPEDYFEVNQFSEEALIQPPQISLQVKDIVEIHQWLHESRQLIAPNPNDPMNEVLDRLGSPPTDPSHLVGHMTIGGTGGRKVPTFCHRLSLLPDQQKMQITLTLRNRNPVILNPEDMTSCKKIRVKQALVELIRHGKSCEDLNEVLFRKITSEEEESYRLTRQRLAKETTAYFKSQSIIFSPHGQSLTTLADYVRLNSQSMNAVSFDEVSLQILQDVRNKIENRERFHTDLERMRMTLAQLKEKRDLCENILKCYKDYISKCLNNMKRMSITRNNSDKKMKTGIRYTGKQLKDKGVLISIKDMGNESKLKDIVFEINPMPEEVGLFLIRIKFKGMEWERVKIELQYLLELQYKGIPHLDLSDRTRVNVNLLIYLLDKKFYTI